MPSSQSEISSDFPSRIKKLRDKLGITQMRLAELMGVSFASVNRWENGQSRPSALAWQQITRAEMLGIEALGIWSDAQTLTRGTLTEGESQLESLPVIDFSADPEVVRVIAEGERLRYGHLLNPSFATEISLIDPLPHQRMDTLAGERMFSRLQEPTVEPYDLVIFDEAHKLSADREPDLSVRKTDRYLLAEALAGMAHDDPRWQLGWGCHHLLLLTATPHMGKDFPYYCLWRLLEPEVLSTVDAFHDYPADARRRHFIRRTKEEMVRFDGTSIYPTRLSDTLSYDLTQGETSEQRLYDETTDYIRFFYNRARILNRSAARLAMSIFQRRLASSTYALMRSFARRLDKLHDLIAAIARDCNGRLCKAGCL